MQKQMYLFLMLQMLVCVSLCQVKTLLTTKKGREGGNNLILRMKKCGNSSYVTF